MKDFKTLFWFYNTIIYELYHAVWNIRNVIK